MRIVFDIYHWRHPDACAELTRGYESREQAGDALAVIAGVSGSAVWQRTRRDNGWIIDPDENGRQTEWGVFERQEAETDSERVQLALEVLADYGQEDGQHHLAWVIDQTVRTLTGDGYEAWVAEYEAGEDGPSTYSWDEGIAP